MKAFRMSRKAIVSSFCFIAICHSLTSCSGCSDSSDDSYQTEEYYSDSVADYVDEYTTESLDEFSQSSLPVFNEVDSVISLLSTIGIGHFSDWKFDQFIKSWYSCTNYFELGYTTSYDRLRNNIACYLDGQEACIKTLKIVLNVNDTTTSNEAIDFFISIIKKTAAKLSITVPEEIETSIKSGQSNNWDKGNYEVALDVDMGNVDTYTFTIDTHPN